MKFSIELAGRIDKNTKSTIMNLGVEDIGDAVIVIRTKDGDSIIQKIEEVESLEVSTSQFKPIELILHEEAAGLPEEMI